MANNRRRVQPQDLGDGISAIIDHYLVDLRAANAKDVKAAGRVSRDILKHETPEGAGKYHDWDEYQSGWQMSTDTGAYGDVTVTIKNKRKPGLTHLLEQGHVMRDGRSAQAYPHIKPAGEKGVEELRRRINR